MLHIPVPIRTAALSLGTLRSLRIPTLPISRLLKILRRVRNGTRLERQRARLPIVTAVVFLQLNHLAAEQVLITIRVRIRSEPLRVVRKAQIDLVCVQAHVHVLVHDV